jgi:ParB family chromosome partitioning protein
MGSIDAGLAWERLESVALDAIDAADQTFRITTRSDLEDLAASIDALGLLVPPLLLRRHAAAVVVSGFRRVAACRLIGWRGLPARILAAGASEYACALRAVGENALSRGLNLIETSRALRLLEAAASPGDRPLADALKLGLACPPAAAPKLRGLCRLPDELQQGILEETISLSMALMLAELEAADALALTRLFRQLRIGLNRQREMLSLVREIAAREDRRVHEVLCEPGVSGPLAAKDLDAGRKAAQLRAWLRRRRFPEIARAEENFRRQQERLRLGEGMRLTPPRDFEGTSYDLTLSFQSIEALAALCKRLAETLGHPGLKAILENKPGYFAASPAADGGRKAGPGED